MRGTPMAKGAEASRIGPQATPMLRPDVKGVAYYEFQVVAAGKAEAGRAGFIIASTGGHDVPIPHFSFERPPVSEQLAATARKAKASVAAIHKVDALCYVGEDAAGALVAQAGPIPPLLRGWPKDPAARTAVTTSFAAPPKRGKDDATAAEAKHAVHTTGPTATTLERMEWKGWADYKHQYAASFAPLLAALRERAARQWQVEALAREFGEGVPTGTTRRVALLEPTATVQVAGDGSGQVRAQVRQPGSGPPVLELVAAPTRLPNELGFSVALRYPSGLEETLQFFLVSPGTPSSGRSPAYPDLDGPPIPVGPREASA
jgi:hypothetical protein